MIAPPLRRALRQIVCASAMGFMTALAQPAFAADASSWDTDTRSSMRLIAGAARGDKSALRAGVELKLNPGWKTYWRYPGDSGVPPRFDFSQSSNVKTVAVSWPAPHHFSDASGDSIGYKDGVIFPLRIEPQDATQPVTLRLKLDYAVCEKLCVPAMGAADLALAGGSSTFEAPLAAAEARVPKPAALGEGIRFAVRSVRRDAGTRPPSVSVDVMAPEHFTVELFAEGPTPDWALPLPKPVLGAPAGDRRFSFVLDGLPPGASATGAVLTLTAVAGGEAIEVKARLD